MTKTVRAPQEHVKCRGSILNIGSRPSREGFLLSRSTLMRVPAASIMSIMSISDSTIWSTECARDLGESTIWHRPRGQQVFYSRCLELFLTFVGPEMRMRKRHRELKQVWPSQNVRPTDKGHRFRGPTLCARRHGLPHSLVHNTWRTKEHLRNNQRRGRIKVFGSRHGLLLQLCLRLLKVSRMP